MIVKQHDAPSIDDDRRFEHLTRMDEDGIERAVADDFTPDGFVSSAKENDTEVFNIRAVGHGRWQHQAQVIINPLRCIQRLYGIGRWAILHPHDAEFGAAKRLAVVADGQDGVHSVALSASDWLIAPPLLRESSQSQNIIRVSARCILPRPEKFVTRRRGKCGNVCQNS